MTNLYDQIGSGYAARRQPDPRIAMQITAALGAAGHIANIGAGAGSYEPLGREVVAVEPSMTMIRQRPVGLAPVVQAVAECLPFRDRAFDASLAVLTIHHWKDQRRGLQELARIARHSVIICTWDPAASGFWLTEDYFPELLAIDRAIFPPLPVIEQLLGPCTSEPMLIPHDCTDGFLGAYWRRPRAYLDPARRASISTFSKIADVTVGLQRLRSDLESGAWSHRHGELLSRESLDLGYRIVTTR